MNNDGQIYYYITCIADSMVLYRKQNHLPREQVSDVITRLETIISDKLPDPTKRHITHNGYKIVAQGQVARY